MFKNKLSISLLAVVLTLTACSQKLDPQEVARSIWDGEIVEEESYWTAEEIQILTMRTDIEDGSEILSDPQKFEEVVLNDAAAKIRQYFSEADTSQTSSILLGVQIPVMVTDGPPIQTTVFVAAVHADMIEEDNSIEGIKSSWKVTYNLQNLVPSN